MKPFFWRNLFSVSLLMLAAAPSALAQAAAPTASTAAPSATAPAPAITDSAATDSVAIDSAATGAATTGSAAAPSSAPAAPAPDAAAPDVTATLQRQIKDFQEKFSRCAALQELSIRLNCYDNYAIELGYITPERAQADQVKISKIGVWQISSKKDGFGVNQTYSRVDSLNTLKNKISERHVGFVVRCVPGRTEVFLDWKDPVVTGFRAVHNAKTIVVNYTVNDSPKETEEWEVSSDQRALFSPDPVAFVRKIMNKNTLTVHFAPSGTLADTARFDITGLDTVINDVIVKNCYAHGMTPNNAAPNNAAPNKTPQQ